MVNNVTDEWQTEACLCGKNGKQHPGKKYPG